MPHVDVGGEIQLADDDVPVGLVFHAARQCCQCRGDVRHASHLVQAGSDHLSEESTGPDYHGKPFFPVLTVVTPVGHVFVNGVEDMNRGRASPGVIEICASRSYRDLFPNQVDIQCNTRCRVIG